MSYLKYFLKSKLSNPYLWGWSVGFMMFWLMLGYLEIGSILEEFKKYGMPKEAIVEAGLCYTASWYASLVVISLGSAAIGLCYSIYYSSMSIRYVTKYSKLKASSIFLQSVLGFIVVDLILSLILLGTTIPLYSYGFEAPMIPKKPLMLLIVLIVTGIFYYVLSTTFVYTAIVLRKPRAAPMLSYLPLILSLGLILTAINVSLYYVNVVSPFNAAALLVFHYYTNRKPPITALKSHENIVTVDPLLLWISLIFWIIILSLVSIALIKKQRGVGAEEILAGM